MYTYIHTHIYMYTLYKLLNKKKIIYCEYTWNENASAAAAVIANISTLCYISLVCIPETHETMQLCAIRFQTIRYINVSVIRYLILHRSKNRHQSVGGTQSLHFRIITWRRIQQIPLWNNTLQRPKRCFITSWTISAITRQAMYV